MRNKFISSDTNVKILWIFYEREKVMKNQNNIFDNLATEINCMTDISEAAKQKILANIIKAKNEPVNLLITGSTGCGKSSTINAMFNTEVAKVGVGVDP